jgi:hypothetical protein
VQVKTSPWRGSEINESDDRVLRPPDERRKSSKDMSGREFGMAFCYSLAKPVVMSRVICGHHRAPQQLQ